MKIVNLTPHELNIKLVSDEDEYIIMNGITGNGLPLLSTPIWKTIPPSGQVARIDVEYQYSGETAGIPIYEAEWGNITGLPAPTLDTIYVVSGVIKDATNRRDVYAPGKLIRDNSGRVIGCQGLVT